jgi:hypothetical protein
LDDKTLAQKIRQFVRDLFGSRLTEHLETEKFHQQTMYEARLLERDQTIAALRQELLRLQAKFDEFELDPSYFWWLAQRGRSTLPPRSDSNSVSEVPASTWQAIQAEHYRKQELPEETNDGLSNAGRGEELR